MPLYTYVVSYNGETHVSQARRSNPTGFADWVADLPKAALSAAARKELASKIYGGFEAIPNRSRVWRRTVTVAGTEMVIVAIQTAG